MRSVVLAPRNLLCVLPLFSFGVEFLYCFAIAVVVLTLSFFYCPPRSFENHCLVVQ
jgi:hypothetical protein